MNAETSLQQVAQRLRQHRINRQLTQAELAEKAGVTKRTIENLESGKSTQFLTVLRTMEALDLLENIDVAIPEVPVSPLLKHARDGEQPQRVRKSKPTADTEWSWGDE